MSSWANRLITMRSWALSKIVFNPGYWVGEFIGYGDEKEIKFGAPLLTFQKPKPIIP